jgi:hypothetical protein
MSTTSTDSAFSSLGVPRMRNPLAIGPSPAAGAAAGPSRLDAEPQRLPSQFPLASLMTRDTRGPPAHRGAGLGGGAANAYMPGGVSLLAAAAWAPQRGAETFAGTHKKRSADGNVLSEGASSGDGGSALSSAPAPNLGRRPSRNWVRQSAEDARIERDAAALRIVLAAAAGGALLVAAAAVV